MNFIIEKFEQASINNYSDGARLILTNLDREEVINQLAPEDVVKVLDIPTILQHIDHHELIAAIGDIEKFVEVFGRDSIVEFLNLNQNEEEQ